jgi:predicted MPP superfamily phosphohydrolase
VRNAFHPILRKIRFEFPNLPECLNGFQVLHLSDLHIDGMDGMAEILAQQIRDIPADLCVMTGDYRYEVNGPCDAIYPRMRTIVSALRAHHGVYAILGNHDEADIALGLADAGVRMLINEAVEIAPGFWLIGVDDAHYYGCDDLSVPLHGVPPHVFKLLLAHTPEIYVEAGAAGIDLYLCGHTHAGQICLPWLGPPLLNAVCPRAYKRGGWQHGKTLGYTSAGIGCSMLPVRYNCPSEITLITLAQPGL